MLARTESWAPTPKTWISQGMAENGSTTPSTGSGEEPYAPPKGWPEPRLKVAQAIWGEEFTKPGGLDVVKDMIRPLALNENMSVVDIGAGLGGSTRTITRETGAWVNGYDEDEELAAAAMKISKMGALAKKAPIEVCDLDAFADVGIRENSIHAVFSKDALFTVADKDTLLETMEIIMKPGGQLMMTDYMAAEGKGENGEEGQAESPAVALWSRFEPRRPRLWDVGRFRSKLESKNFEVRVAEDISEKQRGYVLQGFLGFTEALKTFKGNPELEEWAVREAEFWLHRIAALSSGEVKVYRFYARKEA